MEFDKRIPIYEQLKDHFKQAFAAGIYKLGEPLPSRRDIAQIYQVNPNTVQRAFKELEEEQLIITGNNIPSRVTDDPQIIENLQQKMIQAAVETFYQAAKPLNIEPERLVRYLTDYIEKQRGDDDA